MFPSVCFEGFDRTVQDALQVVLPILDILRQLPTISEGHTCEPQILFVDNIRCLDFVFHNKGDFSFTSNESEVSDFRRFRRLLRCLASH